MTWPWFPPGRRGLWSFWRRRRRCRSTGTTSRGRRWPLRGSCWRGHPLRRGSAGTVCGSPPCSPLPPGPGASPCCLWRATWSGCEHPWLLVRSGWPERRWWIIMDARFPCYRPTDSSAARMPFPGETIRRAVSWSSLFCVSESVGTWCVISTLRQLFGCPVDNLFPLKKIYFLYAIDKNTKG